jgi:arsenate reductase
MYKIYHNPRCRKSRAGLQYLQAKNAEIEIVEYLKEGISEETLKDLLIKLNKKPEDILRKQEEVYKKQLKGKQFSDDEWVKVMVEHPKLIQRPIVVKGYKAVVGDPAEEIDNLN